MIKIMIDMKEFKIVENRGCDVRYDVITGSYSQCIDWLNYNTVEHPDNPDIRISKLEDDVNSNGDYFTYTIEECDD